MYTIDLARILEEPDDRTRRILCRKAISAALTRNPDDEAFALARMNARLPYAEAAVRDALRVHPGCRHVSFFHEPSDQTDQTRNPVSLKKYATFAYSEEFARYLEMMLSTYVQTDRDRRRQREQFERLSRKPPPAAAPETMDEIRRRNDATLRFLEALDFDRDFQGDMPQDVADALIQKAVLAPDGDEGQAPPNSDLRTSMPLEIGRIYRLRFPGIAARVLPNPPDTTVTMHDGTPGYLIETLITKNRWWVNDKGEPNNHVSPHLIVPQPKDTE